jgi:hypothetical protein
MRETSMFEHVWNDKSCSWIVASPGRVPQAEDLERTELYFVWGFLMDPRFIQGLTGSSIPLAPAVLRGYRRETFVRDGERGFRLVPEEDGIVMGVVLMDLTEEEGAALDRFEQVPHVMVKKKVEVLVGDLVREASIYMAAGS